MNITQLAVRIETAKGEYMRRSIRQIEFCLPADAVARILAETFRSLPNSADILLNFEPALTHAQASGAKVEEYFTEGLLWTMEFSGRTIWVRQSGEKIIVQVHFPNEMGSVTAATEILQAIEKCFPDLETEEYATDGGNWCGVTTVARHGEPPVSANAALTKLTEEFAY